MGRSRRPCPTRLAAKLRQIRAGLGLTQEQMFEHLGETKTALYPGHISLYEAGRREPPLPVLLRYARIAGVYVDVLIDDELDLPDKLPATPKRATHVIAKKK
ncbi:MAG: helix-turn-helix transcriptional regulator [Pyrinomonadaceae bacterium]